MLKLLNGIILQLKESFQPKFYLDFKKWKFVLMALCFHVCFLFVQAASHAENKNVLEIDDLSEVFAKCPQLELLVQKAISSI